MIEEERNWAELPPDVLSVIFEKVGAIDILLSAQYVCRPWRQFSFDSRIWKVIDMTTHHGDPLGLDLEKMAREAVDRSQGQLEVFWLEYFGSNDLLRYIANRTTVLRCLHVISAYNISVKRLSKMLRQFPLLEELDITFGSISEKICKYIGKACPHLKCFRLNVQGNRFATYESDKEALAIANHMPALRRLQLVGNILTNKGLTAILENCVHLEYLDIRCCFHVNLDANLLAKCAKIKDLRLPNDPTDDYGFIAETDWVNFDDDEFYPSGYSDIELMYDDMLYDSGFSEDDFDLYMQSLQMAVNPGI